ncbi:hypothetical protein NQ314_006724 [Rhamnusium bicolor]|uniref:Uncharacterized protein n=1 Tax=Rhamnusium bicolor TaxID=1586634 RepID=A0AAV8YZG1_9CUCU|nr:hypothetical protein NQ314_006724 [Rhamnusium bicolor]
MSLHNKQPVASTRHRSSSVRSRPRSLSYYGSNTVPYSSSYSNSSNPYSSISNYNSYSANYQSPYFSNDYRGTSSGLGYASLKIPAKSSSNTPGYSKTYDNNRDYIKNDDHISRRDAAKTNVYNRNRSLSRSRNSLSSGGMGSRSISLTSLNSEGYVVSN